jgi:cytochrome c553
MKIPLRLMAFTLISIIANTYVHAAGNVAAGQEKSMVCQGCHGQDGNSYGPEWPNLASQHAAYIAKQLRDFQSGARKNETMSSMVIGLSQKDITDIAAFFSSQTVKGDNSAKSVAGKKLYEGGNRYNRTPACASCHGPNGVGNGPGAIPHLAGQKATYVAKALRDFRSGSRANDRNEMMRSIAAKLSDKEIENVATYISGMSNQNMAKK